ncbi:MAG: DJ-1/PfpI family protein [Propionibacteriaceae bacterium]|nr:DJ-1/PfpI family protein [Propionibacteriaceae bacterium]
MTMSIGLYAFDDMEMLDFAGPYQVFATASQLSAQTSSPFTDDLFSLVTIGRTLDPVTARAGAVLQPQATIDDHPPLSCLVIPGSTGAKGAQADDPEAVTWISATSSQVPVIAAVCTGAFLLARTGLLDGLQATTHADHVDDLRRRFPSIEVIDSRRWVDAGRFVTSAGLSAGIDMALHLVERMASRELSVATARRLDM